MNRISKGVPAGGQFAEHARADAVVVLNAGRSDATPLLRILTSEVKPGSLVKLDTYYGTARRKDDGSLATEFGPVAAAEVLVLCEPGKAKEAFARVIGARIGLKDDEQLVDVEVESRIENGHGYLPDPHVEVSLGGVAVNAAGERRYVYGAWDDSAPRLLLAELAADAFRS